MKRTTYLVVVMATFALLFSACKKEDIGGNKTPAAKFKLINISTDYGNMVIWLWDKTPLHKANFLAITDTNYLDGTTFHRIIDDFVIQGGDPKSKDSNPNNDGTGGPGYRIPAEFDATLTHVQGAVGAARTNNPEKESNGSQFYIVDDVNGEHTLDGNYTVFGQVISGLDVVDDIAKQPKDAKDRPLTDIKMTVTIIEKTLEELKTEYNFVP